MSRLTSTLGLLFLLVTSVQAQWWTLHDSKTPRTADGKANLSAPAPRVNGKPDLSGVWETERTPVEAVPGDPWCRHADRGIDG